MPKDPAVLFRGLPFGLAEQHCCRGIFATRRVRWTPPLPAHPAASAGSRPAVADIALSLIHSNIQLVYS
ncbi:hypothetical protein C2845_PM13G08270 [Panicum miliaceum]|uniref:Uncharacterized protein n=1 Tax=Panicum miliaceum TaxID=4540 RepID=A0A3L6RHV8_PANMI|nr:hypothetical protein C2845_PM13G08270 [Panicum miliaceum]